jgi:hypothetical protein
MAEFDVEYPPVEPALKPITEIDDPFVPFQLDPVDPFDPELDPFAPSYPTVEPLLKPEAEPEAEPRVDLSLVQPVILALPPLAIYQSKEALFEAIQSWSKDHGYAFIIGRSKRLNNQRQKVYYDCDRQTSTPGPLPTERIRATQSRGSGCPFSILAVELPNSQGWEVKYRPEPSYSTHNHPPSLNSAAHPSHRHLSLPIKATVQELFQAGKVVIIYS